MFSQFIVQRFSVFSINLVVRIELNFECVVFLVF